MATVSTGGAYKRSVADSSAHDIGYRMRHLSNAAGRASGASRRTPWSTCPRRASTAPRRSCCRRFELGEADRVLTLLTPHDGKLKAIAKGVRRPRSRIGGAVEPFAELELVLARGANVRRRHPGERRPCLAAAARPARVDRHRVVPRPSWRSAPSRSAPAPIPSTRCCGARTSCSTTAWRPAAWRAGSRSAWPTRSACAPRSSAASSATGCSRRTSVPLGAGAGRHAVLSGTRRRRPSRSPLSLDALKLLRAYRRLDIEAIAGLRLPARWRRRSSRPCAGSFGIVLEREARSLAFLDEVRTPRPRRSVTVPT